MEASIKARTPSLAQDLEYATASTQDTLIE
jgi:hypothetical protein